MQGKTGSKESVLWAVVFDIQSNALRIEGLVHLVDAYASGLRKPTSSKVSSWFAELGSIIGHLEDPAEDIFTGYVATADGDYRVLEGWGRGYLSRLLF